MKTNKLLIPLLLFLFLLETSPSLSQELTFNEVSPLKENPWGDISSIIQDLQGYMWFGGNTGGVLVNLFNNAFYSVQEKKKQISEGYEPMVSVRMKRTVNQLEIQVRDNGVGIPEKIVDKIFQPFFTTKPTGEGTGLGLSLSYDIITKGHGGMLLVKSTEGEGATFTIFLPVYH